jgi:hypothetical protein
MVVGDCDKAGVAQRICDMVGGPLPVHRRRKRCKDVLVGSMAAWMPPSSPLRCANGVSREQRGHRPRFAFAARTN